MSYLFLKNLPKKKSYYFTRKNNLNYSSNSNTLKHRPINNRIFNQKYRSNSSMTPMPAKFSPSNMNNTFSLGRKIYNNFNKKLDQNSEKYNEEINSSDNSKKPVFNNLPISSDLHTHKIKNLAIGEGSEGKQLNGRTILSFTPTHNLNLQFVNRTRRRIRNRNNSHLRNVTYKKLLNSFRKI